MGEVVVGGMGRSRGRWKMEDRGELSSLRKTGLSRGKAEDYKQQALPSLSDMIATAAPCRLPGRR